MALLRDEVLVLLRVVGVSTASPLRDEEVPTLLLPRDEVLPVAFPLREVELPVREEEFPLSFPLREEVLPVREVDLPESFPLREVEVPLSRVVVLPLRVEVPSEREAELLPRVEMSLSRVPRPLRDSVRLGALLVVRLPVTRSVVVIVLLLRSLVMRLPLRPVGLFCTFVAERGAVTRPTRGRLSYW